jgi:hypothetical protein
MISARPTVLVLGAVLPGLPHCDAGRAPKPDWMFVVEEASTVPFCDRMSSLVSRVEPQVEKPTRCPIAATKV